MTTSKEVSLMDTNILVYAADTFAPFHSACKTLRDKGIKGEISLCVCPQVLLEFFAVATSAKKVTKPRTPKEALDEVNKYYRAKCIAKIYPRENSFEKVLSLVGKHNVKGQEIFDLQLAATMLANNVKRIYTYNTEHFARFKEIKVFTP